MLDIIKILTYAFQLVLKKGQNTFHFERSTTITRTKPDLNYLRDSNL